MKEKTKKNMVTFLLVFIMISSVIGFMWGGGGSQKEKYGQWTFTLKNNQWVTNVDGQEFGFDYFPTEVEDISAELNLRGNPQIDTTYDLEDDNVEAISLAQFQMDEVMSKLNVFLRKGLTSANQYDLPIIDCDSEYPVIYFRTGSSTQITVEGKCVIAESRNAADFIRLKDRLLYDLLGII